MKKLLLFLLVLAGGVSTASAWDHLYVAGVTTLTGKDWQKIELTDEDGDGVYTFTTTVVLTKGGIYEYKYVLDDNWNSANSSNRSFSVPQSGSWKVVFEVNKANAETYDDKSYACNTYAIFQPTEVSFYGMGVTSDSWGGDTGNFSKEGNSWIYTIDETLTNNIYFHFKMNGTELVEYCPSEDKWFDSTNGWTMNMNNWNDYIGKSKSYSLKSFNNAPFGKYKIKITPYHNNLYMEVFAYEKVTTNASGFCTYVNSNPITISDATAYYAVDQNNGSAKAYTITNPVANTPMLIKGDPITPYYFAVAESGTALEYANAFKAGTGAVVSPGEGPYNYILKGDAFYLANGTTNTVATNKAYLQLTQAATARVLLFDDEEEVTGITSVKSENSNVYFDLQGRRVAQPTKGLYIMNGKKFIKK